MKRMSASGPPCSGAGGRRTASGTSVGGGPASSVEVSASTAERIIFRLSHAEGTDSEEVPHGKPLLLAGRTLGDRGNLGNVGTRVAARRHRHLLTVG